MGELSYVQFYPFFGNKRLSTKKIPHWSLLHAFRLSKIEITIEHLLSWARQKSTRSYHNSVSRHHPTDNSLAAFPLWVTFVQSTLQCVFLVSHQYEKYPPPPSIFHLQWHPWYYSYDPIPMSQVSFAAWSSMPSYSEQRKFDSPTLPLPLFNFFPPPPSPHSVGQSTDCLTPFGYLPRAPS